MPWPSFLRRALMAVPVVILAACGSPAPATPLPGTPPSVTLAATPAALTLAAGQSATVHVAVTRSGETGRVTLGTPELPATLDVALATTTPQGGTDATVTVKPGTPPGTYTATLRATSSAATTDLALPVTVPALPDTTPPQVTLKADVTAVTSPRTVTFTADATDDVGIASVALYRAGQVVTTRTAAPWTFPVNLTKADNGQPQFTARATDTSGHETWTPFVTLDVHID